MRKFIALLLFPAAALAQPYSLGFLTIAGGGGTSTNATYTMTDTIGQPVATGPMSGSGYTLSAGFGPLGFGASMVTVTIISPVNSESFSNADIVATGTAANMTGVKAVYVQDTGSAPVVAATSDGFTHWTSPVTLTPGANTLNVYGVNSNGVYSATNQVAFTGVTFVLTNYTLHGKVYSRLLVEINGNGKAAPNDNGKFLQVGSTYTLTAVPGKNTIVSNWLSGSAQPYTISTGPSLRFTMKTNFLVELNFVTNVFLPIQGAYFGLFEPTNGPREQTNSGGIALNVSSAGVLSGTVTIGASTTRLAGKFTPAGYVTNSAARKGESNLVTSLQLDFNNQAVVGSVSDGTFVSPLMANRNPFSAKSKTELAGQYTFVIPGGSDPAVGPYGTSYGTVKISPTGAVTYGGALADGTTISGSSAIASNGVWPLYISLYKGAGSFWSWNYFDTNGIVSSNGVPVAGAAPSWINRGYSLKTALYTNGFTNLDAVILGSPYDPTGQPTLADMDGGPIVIGGGDLIDMLNRSLAVAPTKVNETNIVFTLTKANGVVSGQFLEFLGLPTEKKIAVNGVLLQGQSNVAGFFKGMNASGAFLGP